MKKDYCSKPQNRQEMQDVPCVNERGQRDVLLGMAQAGTNLAKQPLITDNKWARAINQDYQDITGGSPQNLSPDLAELKKIARKYQRKK